MKKLVIMNQFNKISDEELAAYLDGILPEQEIKRINNEMDVDTFEVLTVSRRAMNDFSSDKVIDLPSWENVSVRSTSFNPLTDTLAMAGFLGEINSDEDELEETENDK